MKLRAFNVSLSAAGSVGRNAATTTCVHGDGCGCQVVNAIITATNITTTVLYYNCLLQPCMRCCVFHRKSKRAEDKVGHDGLPSLARRPGAFALCHRQIFCTLFYLTVNALPSWGAV